MGLTKLYHALPIVEWGRARGKAVHRAIELYESGTLEEETLHPDVAGHFAAYKKFKDETGYKPEAFEESVFSDSLRYRGTLDSRGYFTGKDGWAIVDFKCSHKPDLKAAALQLSAYGMA